MKTECVIMQVKAIELYFRVASVIVYKVLPIVMCMPVCIKTKYVTNLMKAIEKLSHDTFYCIVLNRRWPSIISMKIQLAITALK